MRCSARSLALVGVRGSLRSAWSLVVSNDWCDGWHYRCWPIMTSGSICPASYVEPRVYDKRLALGVNHGGGGCWGMWFRQAFPWSWFLRHRHKTQLARMFIGCFDFLRWSHHSIDRLRWSISCKLNPSRAPMGQNYRSERRLKKSADGALTAYCLCFWSWRFWAAIIMGIATQTAMGARLMLLEAIVLCDSV